MEEHSEAFCLSPNFLRCPQFLQGNDFQQETKAIDWANRRKATRINQQEPVTLAPRLRSRISSANIPKPTRDFTARTLDISKGGMRLFAPSPISRNSLIEFSFGRKFPEQLRKAMGKVQWCNMQIDEPGYQIGVAFTERGASRAMEGYIQGLAAA